MARSLSVTLAEAQKYGCVTLPYLIAKIKRRWGGVVRYDWDTLYIGSEDDGPHCATMPSDGSFIRLRVANPATTKNLYYQRIESPSEVSDFSVWSNLLISNVVAVCSASLGTTVSQFYVNTAGELYHRVSVDCGVSWGAWTLIHDIYTVGCTNIAVAYDTSGNMCLVFPSNYVSFDKMETDYIGDATVTGVWRYAQAFRPSETYQLRRVQLHLYRVGSPGSCALILYNADAFGRPVGPYLRSCNLDCSTVTTNPAGDWYNFNYIPITLYSTNMYVFVMQCLSGTICWAYGNGMTMLNGAMVWSDNAGVTWHTEMSFDMFIRVMAGLSLEGNPNALLYTPGGGGSWNFSADNTNTPIGCLSLAVFYNEDWNIISTFGTLATTKGLSGCIYGDGDRYPAGTWSPWTNIVDRADTDPFLYYSPSIAYSDTARLFFVESYTSIVATNHIFYSHSPTGMHFDDYSWLEPVPMEAQSIYGLCFCYAGSYAWLSNSKSVYRALNTDNELDISSKILIVEMSQSPDIRKGYLKLAIDNTAGLFNSFDRVGDEITIGLGFKTLAGNEYSLASSFWIQKYKLESPTWSIWTSLYPTGIIGTLNIEGQDLWDYLRRYKARTQLSWDAGEKTVKQLLAYFLGRSGIALDVISESTEVTTFKPAFTVDTGTTYRTVVKNLLKMVPDQLVFREAKAYLRNPTTAEASDWIYHNTIGEGILLFKGKYGSSAWDPNRVEVYGTTLMASGANFPQVYKSRDRLSRITTPDYPDYSRAAGRINSELRKSEVLSGEDSWLYAMVNCGLEPWDKIKLTDQAAGVSNIYRRVIRIKTYWTKLTYQYTQTCVLGAD